MALLSTLPNLKQDLIRVQERLFAETQAELEFLTQVANHLASAGGKRIRPGFTIAAACMENSLKTDAAEDAGESINAAEELKTSQKKLKNGIASQAVSEDVIAGAVAVELVHLGSLYHDDVMDGAKQRRNTKSVNAEYGDHIAILAGDFLLARASIIAAGLGTQVSRLLAETIARLCEGQILEHRDINNAARTSENYMKAIEGKTASLLSAACEIGAVLGGREKGGQSGEKNGLAPQLREFGHSYGMAFQIIDDISDLLTDGIDMGKPGGNDIVEGNFTLPVIYALEEDGAGELGSLLAGGELQTVKIIELVRASKGPERAKARAADFIAVAKNSIEGLPESPASQAFNKALEHLAERMAELV